MDPVSFTASLFTLIAAVQTGVKGLRKLKSLRKAPDELEALASELESVQVLLKDVVTFVELYPHASSSKSLFECFQRAASKISDINRLLTSPPFKFPKLDDASQTVLLWAGYKSRLIRLRDDLRAVRIDLGDRLGLASLYSLQHLRESINEIVSAQDSLSQLLGDVVERMAPSEQQKVPSTISHALHLLPSRSRPTFCSVPEPLSRPLLASDTPRVPIDNLSELSTGATGLSTRYKAPKVTLTKCVAWCGCKCHTRTTFSSPLILKTIFGKLTIQYFGRRPGCNEITCHRSNPASLNLAYQFPSCMMSRYISLTMRYAPIGGPHFSLRVPKVMQWSHLLWCYANNDNLQAIQGMFSEHKASPYDLNPLGCNALFYAVEQSTLTTTRFLLQQGADPNLPNAATQTAAEFLWERSFAGHFGDEGPCMVESLLKDHEHIDSRQFTTIHKIVLGLVLRDLRSELSVSTAVLNTVDSCGRTPLCWATIRNDAEAVRTLLEFKANPNIFDSLGHTPLHFVQSEAICRLLLEAGVDISRRDLIYGRSALHNFCRGAVCRTFDGSAVGVINLLIQAGLDVNIRCLDGETPLLNAIYSGLTHYARRLLELGADVSIANYSSRDAAIHFAVSCDRHEMLPLLFQKGADYTALNIYHQNIAHMAARCASAKTMKALTDSKPSTLDLTIRDCDGKTPADHLAERCILAEGEEGIQEGYNRLASSIPSQMHDLENS